MPPERVGSEAFDEIRTRFGLSDREVSALFGVSRSAVAKWRRGVPLVEFFAGSPLAGVDLDIERNESVARSVDL